MCEAEIMCLGSCLGNHGFVDHGFWGQGSLLSDIRAWVVGFVSSVTVVMGLARANEYGDHARVVRTSAHVCLRLVFSVCVAS